MNRHREQDTIIRVQKGHRASYARIVDAYQAPIYHLMLRMSGSRELAFDLTQETFVRAFEHIGQYDPKKPFFPWLYTVGMNIARDYRRKNARQHALTSSLDCIPPGSAAMGCEDREHRRMVDSNQLEHALKHLPEETREALILRYREEFSFMEIAEGLHISVSSAKMKVTRGLKKMRRIMAGESP